VDLKALLLVWVDMVVDQWVDLKALLLALVDPVMCQDIGLIFRLAMDFLRQKQLLLLNRRGRVYLVGVQQKVLQPTVVNRWVVNHGSWLQVHWVDKWVVD
jgi:hypothetical protein